MRWARAKAGAFLLILSFLMAHSHALAGDDVLVKISPKLEAALHKGLAHLATRQQQDGAWAGGTYLYEPPAHAAQANRIATVPPIASPFPSTG